MKLKRTRQCKKCPWRKDVDPREIPNYIEDLHCDLKSTIADPSSMRGLFDREQHVMACHETKNAHCVGWLANQLGPGNNIALRLQMLGCENIDKLKLVGEQHECFQDTLPQ